MVSVSPFSHHRLLSGDLSGDSSDLGDRGIWPVRSPVIQSSLRRLKAVYVLRDVSGNFHNPSGDIKKSSGS